MLSNYLGTICAVFVCLVQMGSSGMHPQKSDRMWTRDSDFAALPSFDIEGRGLCVSVAPSDDRSWGVESFLFRVDDTTFGANSLDWYRIHNRSDGIYLYGRETRSEWGLVRVIQGNAWDGSACGYPPEWHVPPALPASQITRVSLDHRLEFANLLTADDSWGMAALDLWFSNSDYPKPLVIDLVVYHDCNIVPACGLRHFEDDDAFHYMHPSQDVHSEDIQAIIQLAIDTTYLPECQGTPCAGTLPNSEPDLVQLDFVIEMHQAEIAAHVNHIAVHTE